MKTYFHTALLPALAGLALGAGSIASAQENIPLAGNLPSTTTATPLPKVARNRVISIMPGDKRSLVLKGDERNPFARRNPDVDLITEETEQETEADLIRNVLNNLPITGRSNGPQGYRVLAGEIIFERGKMVDQVIESQTENLIVERITDTSIELAWIDAETGKLNGKRLTLTYDLTPKVRYLLKGPGLVSGPDGDLIAADGTDVNSRRFGTKHAPKETPSADQIATDQLPNDIPATAFKEGQ
ncbi:MAG: hypothetical protein KDN19_05010 [Verrucomicrobiae bacterium]|nr:hypothetical protein [Verrucomicrobiae bacterium]